MSVDLQRLITGHQVAHAVHVAARLGVADLLAEGPRTSDELAEAVGAHAPTLYRLLRALASVGVLKELEGRRFELTEAGAQLRTDVPDSLADWAQVLGRPYVWQAWGGLLHSVRTGENAFRHVHGTDVWQYRTEHPDESAIFDGAMRALTTRVSRSVLDTYDFGRFGTVVDVGGGNGTFLAALLERYPALSGILFDQPHVVAGADVVLADVESRCRVIAGSFFDSVPEGGDAYLLKSIVHDWEDEEAVAILRTCRAAMAAGASLLLVERGLGPRNEAPGGKFSDLNMLVMPGGRERTNEEYATLFEAAGLRAAGVTPCGAGWAVFAAQPRRARAAAGGSTGPRPPTASARAAASRR